ncbi:hypothetical protein HHL16_12105 [Pseudoflavitalea sp. G-6-1-2]|uniref:hypothetical protein n=1 Tax=Pseudoflavitalea sp. G-6-1-2 TaxID=2728841 RepID=UPI00146F62B4|nr:hypothetical protein [Pseudoflavitalea sp. G-6-1-2]NML21624.1 hypothetical protein [Pseudoflavitalea sp. G-6-1-2]
MSAVVNKHKGPNPGITAVVYVALFALSLIAYFAMSNGTGYPIVFGSPEENQRIFLQYGDALRINAFLQFGSAIPLGLFTATVCNRLDFLDIKVAGISIAFFGGMAASLFMALNGLSTWVLTQPGVADNKDILHAFQLFGFATGGVAHIAGLGLLMAGIAVPCLLLRLTPRWVAWLGLLLAVVSELSVLSFIFFPFSYLLPVARFGSFIWMICTGFTLTKTFPMRIKG